MQIPVHCAHDEMVAIGQLKPNPHNPNQHPPEQIALLAKIIKAQGWRNPIVVSNRSGLITKGHARLAAAQAIGCKTVPVDRQDYGSEKEELADMIADNRIAELAEADRSMLRELAEQLDDGSFDMDLTGFDQVALEELMTAAPPESDIDAEPQIDKAAELAEKWGVKRGQIWQLGEHRLMCGDATKDSKHLLNGDRPKYGMHDPPYGIEVVGVARTDGASKPFGKGRIGFDGVVKANTYHPVVGDDKQFNPEQVLNLSEYCFLWGGNYYADKLPPMKGWVVWDKKGREEWRDTFSDCELAWTNIKTVTRIFRHIWLGMIQEGSREKRVHPTQKPAALYSRIISELFTESGLIIDFYCGCGPTIIACEQLGRKCRVMEIDPGYCAVSIQRWADATGKTPKLLNGR